ncbi:MAG: hypothetical protein IJ523_10925 [Succinivibrionaceae bacterium]|nr:hypothetical protein [Succinivibrionaceae bacterium]
MKLLEDLKRLPKPLASGNLRSLAANGSRNKASGAEKERILQAARRFSRNLSALKRRQAAFPGVLPMTDCVDTFLGQVKNT